MKFKILSIILCLSISATTVFAISDHYTEGAAEELPRQIHMIIIQIVIQHVPNVLHNILPPLAAVIPLAIPQAPVIPLAIPPPILPPQNNLEFKHLPYLMPILVIGHMMETLHIVEDIPHLWDHSYKKLAYHYSVGEYTDVVEYAPWATFLLAVVNCNQGYELIKQGGSELIKPESLQNIAFGFVKMGGGGTVILASILQAHLAWAVKFAYLGFVDTPMYIPRKLYRWVYQSEPPCEHYSSFLVREPLCWNSYF